MFYCNRIQGEGLASKIQPPPVALAAVRYKVVVVLLFIH